MSKFADQIAGSFPPLLTLPAEFRAMLEWMEANGYVHTYRTRDARYASLFPGDHAAGSRSSITLAPIDAAHAHNWSGIDDAASGRLAPFIRTGGDGSHAALWLDDEGRQRFVDLGSGSGSVMMCVLTDDPVDMLRLLAIGYDELCWPDRFHLTAAEAADEDEPLCCDGEEQAEFALPLGVQRWVETSFGVTIPATASEIVRRTASMMDDESDDPFWRWIRRHQAY